MKTLNGNPWFQTLERFLDWVHSLSMAAACESPHELDPRAQIRRTPTRSNFEIRPKTIANAHGKLSKLSQVADFGSTAYRAGCLVRRRANYQLCTFSGEITGGGFRLILL
jgi:hypothetical protein